MNPTLLFRYYADLAGEENAKAYKTLIFLAGSASAEFFADIGLCPFEAVKVSSLLKANTIYRLLVVYVNHVYSRML